MMNEEYKCERFRKLVIEAYFIKSIINNEGIKYLQNAKQLEITEFASFK